VKRAWQPGGRQPKLARRPKRHHGLQAGENAHEAGEDERVQRRHQARIAGVVGLLTRGREDAGDVVGQGAGRLI